MTKDEARAELEKRIATGEAYCSSEEGLDHLAELVAADHKMKITVGKTYLIRHEGRTMQIEIGAIYPDGRIGFHEIGDSYTMTPEELSEAGRPENVFFGEGSK